MSSAWKSLSFSLLLAALFSGPATAQEFKVGTHYDILPAAKETSDPTKIEVVELFWYGCPHCFSFEPFVEKWLANKADDVVFIRIPAVFSKTWALHAKAFYAAEQMGILEAFHSALFSALHREKQQLFTQRALVDFVAAKGWDAQGFEAAFTSFSVDGKFRQAQAATRDYGIRGVPSVIINGKYVTSASKVSDYDLMLKLIDHLADIERNQ
ncbi:MAG: thiol:disulfide interchange protein DsbA/DsbL [Pseudomonadota bacterium]